MLVLAVSGWGWGCVSMTETGRAPSEECPCPPMYRDVAYCPDCPLGAGRVLTPLAKMLAHLDGLPVTRASSMPPGSICGLCARDRHSFVHPKDIPGSRWSLVDGCPCCETHVPTTEDVWGVPPLGTESVDV